MPAFVLVEMFGAAVVLPHAVANTRWPVSQRVSCTDATPVGEGACTSRAETPYRTSKFRNDYVWLECLRDKNPPTTRLMDPDPTVTEIVRAME